MLLFVVPSKSKGVRRKKLLLATRDSTGEKDEEAGRNKDKAQNSADVPPPAMPVLADGAIAKDKTTDTSSMDSLSSGGESSHKKRKWRVKRLLQALSFERAPSPPATVTQSMPSTNSLLSAATFGNHSTVPSSNEECQQTPVHVIPVLHGIIDPDGEVEVIFYDAQQDGDDASRTFHGTYQRESIVLSNIHRGGGKNPYYVEIDSVESGTGDVTGSYPYGLPSPAARPTEVTINRGFPLPPKVLPPPPPPKELPLRFLRAGKGNATEGLRRYELSLQWRKQERVDTILREASPHFDLIKKHYKHYCHGVGKSGEPCYYEKPPKTNLKALRQAGVTVDMLLRHYVQVTEFQWQFLERDDLRRSIYIIDCEGMRFGDFVGEVVDFVKQASKLSNLHYPERAGFGKFSFVLLSCPYLIYQRLILFSLPTVFVINVPSWFKLIWR
jgi:hypothetical protein